MAFSQKIAYAGMVASAVAGFFAAAVPFGGELAVVSNLAVLLFALPAFYSLQVILPQRRWLVLLALSIFAIGIEALSITTGFPYGFFTYGDKMGWQLAELVPWTVPFAWIPLVVGAFTVASLVAKKAWLRTCLAVLILLIADLLLDPVAVKLGFWQYATPGSYFGVPLSNFAGWVLSGLVGVAALYWALRGKVPTKSAAHGLQAILIFWTTAAFTLQLTLPGCIGVGLIILIWGTQNQKFRLS
jgi:putative membrane protein